MHFDVDVVQSSDGIQGIGIVDLLQIFGIKYDIIHCLPPDYLLIVMEKKEAYNTSCPFISLLFAALRKRREI